jgi:hypothetical protein
MYRFYRTLAAWCCSAARSARESYLQTRGIPCHTDNPPGKVNICAFLVVEGSGSSECLQVVGALSFDDMNQTLIRVIVKETGLSR